MNEFTLSHVKDYPNLKMACSKLTSELYLNYLSINYNATS